MGGSRAGSKNSEIRSGLAKRTARVKKNFGGGELENRVGSTGGKEEEKVSLREGRG